MDELDTVGLGPVTLDPTRKQVADYVRANAGGLDPAFILGVVTHESSFNPRAFLMDRNGGSYGLMQLDLPTARDRGFTGTAEQLYDPATNLKLGIAQLVWISNYLAKLGRSSQQNIAAAYNEGVGNVAKGLPDPLYVQAVINATGQWQQILQRGYQ